MKDPCLCGRKRPWLRCCGQYLTGDAIAPTAEALMRSRYSAFCQGNIDYLIATHHPTKRTKADGDTLSKTIRTTRWLNLLIVGSQKGQKKDKTGVVEFVAAYRNVAVTAVTTTVKKAVKQAVTPAIESGDLNQLHEKSYFVKEKGQWFYLEGDILPAYRPKPSALCWCGSGEKFKRCHGRTVN